MHLPANSAGIKRSRSVSGRHPMIESAVARTIEMLEARRLMAMVTTDAPDYHYGEIALISGKEFAPNEPVQLQVTHVEGTPGSNEDAENAPWVVEADAEGNVSSTWSVTDPDAMGATYTLTAQGMTSGASATTLFTDSVTVTPASGGTAISADKAANATSPQYTTLGNIVITEPGSSKQDIAPSQTNATLILAAPTNWRFNAGVGTVSFTASNNITAASINVTSTTITVTFSTNNGSMADTLTISGIQVRAVDGGAGASTGNILRSASSTSTISGVDGTTNFGTLSQVVGAAKTLSVTAPASSTVGQAFSVAVTARDQFNNIATGYTGTVTFSSSDAQAVLPANYTFVGADAGVHTFTNAVTLKNAGSRTVTATDTVTGTILGSATVAVAASSTSTALTSSLNPALSSDSILFTATVTAVSPGTGTPGGTVDFFDGATLLGSGILNGSGQATLATAALSRGSHSITAVYAGNSNFITSTSSALTQVVNNRAPTANAQSITTTEDNAVSGTLTASDPESDTLTYAIVANPTNGTISSFNATTGAFTYTPNPDYNGADSFTFKVNDGTVDSTAATVSITVNSVNDVPSFTKGADQTLLEDATAQSIAGWATSISKGPANEAAQTVSFLVSNDNNALFSVQPAISATGTLTFTPAANAFGTATVTVQIKDSGGTANGGVDTSAAQTFVITLNPVNDVPSFTKGANQTVNEDAAAQSVASWAIAISPGPANESTQSVQFLVSNNNNALFLVQPTIAADGTLSYTPAANANGTATVTVQIKDDGGTASGGVDTSAAQTFTITVNPVNDAPVLNTTSATLPAINEDDTTNTGMAISTLVTSLSVSDVDSGALKGIAIVSADSANGAWQYSINSGTNWTAFTPSAATARLLADSATTRVRFIPNTNFNGTATFTFRAWDQTSGTNGSTADASVNGGITAFSSASGTATITVNPVNDAPTLGNTAATLPTILEDDTTNAGTDLATLVSSLSITEVDAAALKGIAISGVVNTNGTWQFSTDGGSNWTAFGSPSATTARLLADSSSNRIRFVPSANFNGTATFTYRAWDQFTGADGGTVDTSVNGGTSAFSSASGTATITVTAVNDAPTVNAISDPAAILEDAAQQTINLSGIGTGAANETQTITITATSSNTALIPNPTVTYTSPNATGTLSYTPVANMNGTAVITVTVTDNGGTASGGVNSITRTFTVTVNAVNDAPSIDPISNPAAINEDAGLQTVNLTGIAPGPADESAQTDTITATSSNTALIPHPTVGYISGDSTGTLAYTPVADANGTAIITVTATDNLGGSTVRTFTVTVNAVNDAPILNTSSTTLPAIAEDDTANTGTALSALIATLSIVDIDAAALKGIAITAADNANGAWQYSTNSGSTWTALGSVTESTSRLLSDAPANRIRFVPSANFNGIASFTFRAWDRSSGTDGNTANASINDGITGFSGTSAVATIAVSPVNDAPILGITAVTMPAIDEDDSGNTGVDLSTLITGLNVTDVDAAAIKGIAVTAVTNTNGSWQFSTDGGTNWTAFGSPSGSASRLLADSATNRIRFVPNANFNGTATFTFRAWDQTSGTDGGTASTSTNGGITAFSSASGTATITINAISDAPIVTLPGGSLSYSSGSGAIIIDATATVSDIDNSDFNGGTLTVDFATNGTVDDRLAIKSSASGSGNINISGSIVRYFTSTNSTKDIGTFTGGTGITPLVITLNANAGVTEVQSLLRNLTFANVVGNPSTLNRTVRVVMTDGAGGTSSAATKTVTVTDTNDAPVLASATPTFPGILEDDLANAGTDVATFIAALNITDADSSALKGIALTGSTNTNGSWEYSINSGSTWTALGSPSDASARLLGDSSSNRIRFVPSANYNGTATFTFRAWDQTSGANGGTGNASTNGGTTAFSSATGTGTITITAVNDAPTLNAISDPAAINEDAAQQTINLAGIATGATNESQTITVTAVSSNTALIPNPTVTYTSPNATGSLAYTPVANMNGTAVITVTVTDSGGTTNGGINSVTRTFTVTVNPVNDAPSFVKGANVTVPDTAGAQTLSGWATLISAGPSNESTQTVNFLVSNNNNAIFAVQPAILSDGTLSFTPNVNVAGVATVSVQLQDDGGTANGGQNTSASQTFTITVNDTTAPLAPAITGYATDSSTLGDFITSDNTIQLSGTAEANSTVRVFDGATLLGTPTASAGGAWSYTTATLADGAHSFTAKAVDASNNVSPASAAMVITIDTVAPAAPVITGFVTDTGVTGDNVTSDQTLDFTGTAEANTTVQIYDGVTLLGGTTANGSGNWSFSTGTLAGGAHSFTGKAIDAAGNVSAASTTLNVTIDITPPAAPSTPDLATASDSGSSSTDNITNINAPTFTGTAEAGSTVTIFADGVAVGSGVATGGNYSITVSALTNGSHAITASAADAAGNVGASSGTLNITVDAIAPAAPSTPDLADASDSGTSNSDDLTNLATPTFTGTAEAGSTVKLFSDGVLVGSTTATGGNWSITSSALSNGAHVMTATATDTAGNVSPVSSGLSITVDLTAPAAPAITGIATDTGTNGNDAVTSDQTLILSGTAEANSIVAITRVGTGVIGTANANASGNWTFDYTAVTLNAGGHSFTATAKDAAGNTSASSATFNVTIDLTAPAAPVITGIVNDTGASNSDGITSDTSLILNGTAEANALVTLFRDSLQIGTANANGSGAFTFDYTGTTLAEGSYSFTATATDAAGNLSATSSTFNVTIDASAPNAPAITGIVNDSGSSNSDGVTNDPTLIINGTAEANSTVTVLRNGVSIGTTTATAGGTWSLDTTGTTLSAGTYSFTATAKDAAGNTSATSGAFTVVIDLSAPAAPAITSIITDTGLSSADKVTSDQTLVIGGTAEANSLVTVLRNGSAIGTTFASGAGAWSFDYTGTTLAEGAYSFTANATDLAGNVSATSPAINVTVDITPPAMPVISSFATDSGTLGDFITSDNTLVLSGTAEANTTVQIFDGATLLGSATATSGGAFTFTTAALAEGSHSLTAKAVDAAGNTSAASNAMVLVIDTLAPAAPAQPDLSDTSDTGGSQTDNVTFVTTPLFTGTAAANCTISISDGGTLLGTTTSDASGNWSFLTPDNKALSSTPGGTTHTITAKATDAAGNVSALSSGLVITVADQGKLGAVAITNQAPKPVNPGGTAAFDLTLTRGDQKNSGGNLNVDLTIAWPGGLPTGVSVLGPIGAHAVTLRSDQPVTTVIFRIATTAATPAGIYPFTMTAGAAAGTVVGSGILVVGYGPDLAPNAVNDTATTAKNTPVNINVLVNDLIGPFGSPFSITSFTSGSNGIVQNLGGGIMKYTPVTNFTGTDTFTYTITDGNGFSDTALVTVFVDAGNVAPVANADSYTTNENTPLVITAPGVLANDSDANGNTLTAHLDPLGGPFHGTLTLNLNGSFTYTPTAGYNGSDSFIYYADDGAFVSNEVMVSITIGSTNDAPVNSLPAPQSMSEDTTLVFSTANGNAISVSDPDADPGNVRVTLSVTNGTLLLSGVAGLTFNSGANGSGAMAVTGTIASINAALNGLAYTPTANFHGIVSLAITTNDLGNTGSGGPLSDSDTLSITVNSVNDAPTASAQSVITNQNTPKLITLTGNDIDGDALAFVVTSLPAHGGLYDNGYLITSADVLGDGYTMTGAAVSYVPDTDYFGLDNFNFLATDGQLDSAPAAVSVTVLDKTGPVINLSGSIGAELDAQTQSFTWSVTDPSGLGSCLVTITKNGSSIFNTTADSGTFNFDSEGLGNFQISVVAVDTAGNSSNASRAVAVSDDDIAGPAISITGSNGLENDGQTQAFNWNISDPSGVSALSVVITKNGAPIHSTSNLADATGTFNFDSFGLGNFQISISATDADADRAGDTVLATASQSVTVSDDDVLGPSIILSGSTGSENDGQPQSFTWNISDPSGLSALSVIVRQDGNIVHQTTSLADANGSFAFDTLGLGVFTIDVSATDNDADRAGDSSTATASRSVTVSDDDSEIPVITLGGSQNTENDGKNQVFTWNVTDASNPLTLNVVITQNGNIIHTTSDAAGSFDFNSYGLGTFEITVNATDADADRDNDAMSSQATRSVTVGDDDALSPTIVLGGSEGSETDGATNHFTWNISDAGAGLGSLSVIVRKDGNIIYQTNALADAIGSCNFDSEGLGTFTIEVSATDADSDRADDALTSTASRSVVVSDDDIDAPIITLGGSENTENDGQNQVFTWDVTDPSGLSSCLVTITKNGQSIHTTSDLAGSFDFNSYGLGTFEIAVTATDADSDRANDSLLSSATRSVTVSDDDSAAPVIVIGGSEGSETDGQTNGFSWNITDGGSGLGSLSVIIRKNGNTIYQTTSLANAVGSFNFNSEGLGTYTIDISATDADSDRADDAMTSTASQSVIVSDDDTAGPVIILNGSQNTENDGQDQLFTWNVSDVSGLTSASVVITQDGNVIHTDSAASGSFDFNSYGLGTFEITVDATDADADRAGDTSSSTMARSVIVSDDDTAAPIINLGGSTGAETDGDTNHFTWNVSDTDSGLATLNIVITRDDGTGPVMVYSTSSTADAVDAFNFDTLGLGTYTINVSATDSDGDRADDSMSASATRTVVVTDDDTTAPVIVLGGSEGIENDGQNQHFTWNVLDSYSGLDSVLVTITKDGQTIHASTDAVGSFDFNSLGLGDYQISVTATDSDADRANDSLTALASHSVTVTDDDTTGPVIVLNGSENTENDGQTQSFSWNINDADSGLAAISVIIRQDGTIIHQTTDLADAVGSFNFDSYGLGTFTIEVSATDADSDRADDAITTTASRSVIVSDDDTTGPVITLNGSQGTETDGQQQIFTWSVSDPSSLSNIDVTITKDGNVIHTSHVANGFLGLDAYGLGVFEITVTATDADADRANDAIISTATRSVTVMDDDIDAPNIVLGGSQGVETDGDTNYFTWEVTDSGSGIGELSVIIRRNGAIIYETTDIANAISSFDFDSYGLGTYTLDVVAVDADSDRSDDSLSSADSRIDVVNDDDVLAPVIFIGGSQNTENDGQNQNFFWNVGDPSGLGTISVVVTRNGQVITTSSDATGSFDFNSFGLGDYQIQISATDADADRADDALTATASRSVTVTDDDVLGPSIVLGGSQGSETDNLPQSFTWDISDPSGLSALSVVIRHDGNIVYETNDLANANGSFVFNHLGLGEFTIEVSATDNDGDRADDTTTATASRNVTVTDDDSAAPVILIGGSNGAETDGATNHFTWNISDAGSGLATLSVSITRNGVEIFSTTDLANAVGSFNFDSYGPGTYAISATATDADSDRPSDELSTSDNAPVIVSDDDTTAPVITLDGSQNTENDGQNQHFTWNVSDVSGLSSVNVAITKNGNLVQSLTSSTGDFDFNALGLGTYEITVNATDADTDFAADQLSNSMTRSVTVSDDDTTAPVINLGGSTGAETDGDTNHFTWDILDLGSGIDSFLVTITRDGLAVFSTATVATGSFNFDALGLGDYQMTVTAADNDHDWVGDSLSNSNSRSVSVSDDDVDAPTIDLGGSQGSETDAANQHFTWNVSDVSGLSNVLVTVTKNGNVIQSYTSASGSFDFNALGLGTYEISVTASDADSDRALDSLTSSMSRSVNVSDDDTAAPVILIGGSVDPENDGQTQFFTWNISDAGSDLASLLVTIKRNGATIFSTTAQANSSFNFDSYGLGMYVITVSATDADTDWAGDQLSSSNMNWVTVSDDDTAAPTIALGGSQNTENDGQDQNFTWNVTDASGLSGMLVTIRKNGNVIQSFTAANGSFDFNSLGLGTYDITVTAADNDNDWTGDISSTSATRSVTVNDDDTIAPVIDLGGSQGAETDQVTNAFTWNVSDVSGLDALLITITKDGSTIFQTTDLAQAVGSFNFDTYGPGNYEINVSATDNDNDWNGDRSSSSNSRSVSVSDDDTAAPVIDLGGSQANENDGQNQHFTWDITDASGLSNVLVTVNRNGLQIFSSIDAAGSFDFNADGLGDYTMTVSATDNDTDFATDQLSNSMSRSVSVSDDDTTAPTINLGGSTGAEHDGLNQNFTWNVSDASGLAPVSITVYKNGLPVFASSNPNSAFDFNSLGLGTYQLVVSATDADTDWTGDQSSSNDSRTVVVSDDDTDAPVINLGGSIASETDGQNQHFTWDVSDFSGFASLLVTVTRNGSSIFTSSAPTGSFDFNSFGLGNYEITVNALDADTDWLADQLSNSASRSVSVTDDDTTIPTIVLGGSSGAETDGDTNHFTWNVSDASDLSSLLVTIKRNGAIVHQTNLLADSSDSFNFDSLGLGDYEMTVSATDADQDWAGDTMSNLMTRAVTVSDDDTAEPQIEITGSQGFENDGQNQLFGWNVTDASGFANLLVTISHNGSVVQTFSNATGSFDFNTLGLGTFDITVNATDNDNDRAGDSLSALASRSVTVSDDDTSTPIIDITGSQGLENDGQDQQFAWNVSDLSGLSNILVTILHNGVAVQSFNTAAGSFDFNTLGLGTFTIEVSATDADTDFVGDQLSNTSSRTVTVSDDDVDAPSIVLGGSQGTQTDGDSQFFTWNVTDPSGLSSVTVTITQDGGTIHSSSAASGTFNFDSFGLGVFQIHVTATDGDGDRAGDTSTTAASRSATVVDDDVITPIISLGGSQGFENDGQSQSFNWNVSDASGLNSLLVEIKRNGSTIHTSTNANSSFAFDSYGVGTYEMIVSATDADADRAGDSLSDTQTRTVIVSDDDITPPSIILSGSTGSENDGQNQNFTWNVADPSGLANLSVTIRKDGNIIHQSSAANDAFDFNSLGLGTYEISVSATDNDTDWNGDQLSNSATRTVTVSDDDVTAPSIVITGSTGAENDGQAQSFAWNVTDGGSGLASLSIVITRNGSTIFSTTNLAQASGNFNFDSYGLGNYEIQISATDNDTDWTGDQLSSTASRSVSVSDDDTAVPTIVLGGSQGLENDGQNQLFTWNISDASGIASALVTITKNGSVVNTFTTTTGSFDFNSLGLGTFEISVSATDNDNDRAGDSLSSSATRSVTVSDDDIDGPSIVLGGSQGTQSHSLTREFTWNVSDPSGLSAVSITVRKDGNVIYTTSNAISGFNFDSYGLGTFVIDIAATDADNDRASDDRSSSSARQVIVTNANPLANAGADKTSNEGSLVNFNGGASSDADGDTLSYFWNFGDGSTGAGLTPVHTYADNGDYTVTLTVNDGWGGQATDALNVHVNNVAPTPHIAGITNQEEGALVSLSSSFTDPGADTQTYNWHVVSTNGQVITDGSGSTFNFTPNDNGIYDVTLTVTDDDGGAGTAVHTVYVSNVAPLASTTGEAGGGTFSKQYSDVQAPLSLVGVDASSVDVLTATIIGGLPANSGLSASFNHVTRNGAITGKANLAPGTYNVTVRISDDDGGFGDITMPVTVMQEDAVATYTGSNFAVTPANSSIATVVLRATIQDITAAAPGLDPDAGDIRNARVTFINRDTNTVIAANLPVSLLDPSDAKTGVATYNWNVDLGSAISQSTTIGIVVSNYYTRDAATDNTLVTVVRPLEGFITGGGYYVNKTSAGWLAGAAGLKTNFGFNVKYSKSGNPQGNLNVIVRSYHKPDGSIDSLLHVYQIKSNAINWLATQTDLVTGKKYAAFNAKCNVQDITNPLNVISVAGGLTIDMTMTDGGEGKAGALNPDSIGFTVYKGSDLLYSSDWNGVKTVEDILGGGNVDVHELNGSRK